MTDAGWYDDYEDASRLRWYDGTAWTEHVSPKVGDAAAPPPAAAASAPAAEEAGPVAGQAMGESKLGLVAAMLFLGLFGGLLLGGCIFNGAGAITPVTVEAATLEDIEIDFSARTSSTAGSRTYYISGTTASGKGWQIASEDAYNVVEREGWPQQVEVAIGDWTDTAERVTGNSFEVDHQTTVAKVGWGVAIIVLALAGLVASVAMARRSPGVMGALVFAFGYFLPGTWLGYIAVQWVQSP